MTERNKSPRAKSGGFSKGSPAKTDGKKRTRIGKKEGEDFPKKRYAAKDDAAPKEYKKRDWSAKKDSDSAPKKRYGSKDDNSYGDRPKRTFSVKKEGDTYPKKRYGSSDEKPRSEGGYKKEYSDRKEGDSYPKKRFSSRDDHGSSGGYRRNQSEGDSYPKKRYGSRDENDRKPRYDNESSGERKSFSVKKAGDSYPKKRYESRDDNDRKPRYDNESGGERKSFSVKKAGDTYPKKRYDSNEESERKPRYDRESSGEKKSFTVTKRSDDPKPKLSYKDRISFIGDDEAPKKRRSSYEENKSSEDRKESGFKRTSSRRENTDDSKPTYSSERTTSEDGGYFKGGKSKDFRFNQDSREDKPKRRVRRDINAESEILTEIVENRKKTGRLVEKPKVLSLSYEEKVGPIRLNKYISNAGICSRREADTLIESGAIMINGVYVTELGIKVMPTDEVRYGDRVLCREKSVYLLLNKPKDYLTTLEDDRGRKNVMELIQGACRERVYPVGRLDRNTTGLLLFTNDGEMAKKLMHPKFGIKKVYQVELDKNLKQPDLEKITEGITLDDTFIKPDLVAYINPDTKREVGVEIHSGQNRVVRRMFESLGYKVVKLDRTLYAGLTKKDLPRGRWRILDEKEVNILKRTLQ